MGGLSLGVAIEALVAVLLAVTIGYCILVNRKLDQLRSDQSELRMIVRELNHATGQAEQAIAGLRKGAHIADESLGQQIERVRALDENLLAGISKGEALLVKLSAMQSMQQKQGSASATARQQAQPIRQSAVGIGMLNKQRRNRAEASGKEAGHDEVAA